MRNRVARDVQARICGGPGWATTPVYPAQEFPILHQVGGMWRCNPRAGTDCLTWASYIIGPDDQADGRDNGRRVWR